MSFPTSRAEAFSFVPRLRAAPLVERFGNEAVIWNPDQGTPIYLDAVASLLLGVVDGFASVSDLIDDVREAVGIDEATATEQVLRVVGLYHSANLLEVAQHSLELTDPAFEFDPPDF